jgi:N-acetyl-anhydromuramyl-L-alanine amidase AmpD
MFPSWMITAVWASSGGPGPDAPFPTLSHSHGYERPGVASSEPLQPMIDAAAAEFGVPAVLLSALVWEASHYDPDVARQWAGYGPLDLREDRDPGLERAAALLGVSADELVASPEQNVRGGAALLADQARRSGGGELPDVDLLEAWWDATKVFSGSHDLVVQRNFAAYLYEQIWYGVDVVVSTGEHVHFGAVPVDLPGLVASDSAPGPALPDYPGSVGFVPACSDNYTGNSRSGSDIQYVVVHTTQGSYSGTISWFQNCYAQVSAHYVVRSSDGEITQMVDEEDIGWHAGNWTYNEQSIGIEHEGYVEDPDTWYTDEMYTASAALVVDILSRTSVIGDRNHIIGHVEVPGATHTDPGSGWDWTYYMALIEGSWVIAGDLTGVVAAEDIFTGERIPGARVTVQETGEQVEVDEGGVFLFPDLPEGEYTVTATADGYTEGSCTTTIDATGTFWCSIALFPAPEEPEEPEDLPEDEPEEPSVQPEGFAPQSRIPIERSGCGCAQTGGAGAWWALALLLAYSRVRPSSQSQS